MPDLTSLKPAHAIHFSVPGDRVMQSFTQDPQTGDWYVAKVGSGNDANDTRIYRLNSAGALQDWATLAGGGHGSTMGLQRDADGVWLWFWWRLDTTGGNYTARNVRWKYSGDPDGKTVLRSDPDVQQIPNYWDEDTYVNYAIDPLNMQRVAVRVRNHDTETETYELRNISEYLVGVDRALETLGTFDASWSGSYQGHATFDGHLYRFEGNTDSGHPLLLHQHAWTDTLDVQTINVTGAASAVGGWLEAEGCYVTKGEQVMFGLATGAIKQRQADAYKLVPDLLPIGDPTVTNTFSTDTNPALFLEVGNASTPTRLAKGSTVLVRDAVTGDALDSTTITNDLGYLDFTIEGVLGVQISGDNGSTWKGPFWSKEARESSITGDQNGSRLLDPDTGLIKTTYLPASINNINDANLAAVLSDDSTVSYGVVKSAGQDGAHDVIDPVQTQLDALTAAFNAAPLVQQGHATMPTVDAATVASLNITFDVAYDVIPEITATAASGGPGSFVVEVSYGAISTTGFTLYSYRKDSSGMGVSWVATGPRPVSQQA